MPTSDSRTLIGLDFSLAIQKRRPAGSVPGIHQIDGPIERLEDGAVGQRKGPQIRHRPSAPRPGFLASHDICRRLVHQHLRCGLKPVEVSDQDAHPQSKPSEEHKSRQERAGSTNQDRGHSLNPFEEVHASERSGWGCARTLAPPPFGGEGLRDSVPLGPN